MFISQSENVSAKRWILSALTSFSLHNTSKLLLETPLSPSSHSLLTGATIALAPQVQQQVLQDGRQVLIVQELLISPLAEGLAGVVPKQHLRAAHTSRNNAPARNQKVLQGRRTETIEVWVISHFRSRRSCMRTTPSDMVQG